MLRPFVFSQETDAIGNILNPFNCMNTYEI
jgi:hypothetical protein